MSTPPAYLDASWRCTLPYDSARDRIGVGINTADGVLRVAFDRTSALWIVDTLLAELSKAKP